MRPVFLLSALLSSALIVLGPGSAAAQTNGPRSPSLSFGNPGFAAPGADAPGRPSSAERNQADLVFLMQAALGGHAEVQLAQLADQKSRDDVVRDFARRMIQDHSQANSALRSLIHGGNPAGEPQPDAESRQVYSSLNALTGPEFDIEYLRVQVQNHQRMAQLAEYEIGSGADPDVQYFAADMLPKIFSHLSSARELLQHISAQNPQIAAAPPRIVTGMPAPQTPRSVSN
jgi:putative membrane protein